MSDLISRQAAIDALGDMVMNWTDSDYELGQLNQWKADRKAIIDLPSAQPQRMKGRWIETDNEDENGNVYYLCSVCNYSDVHSKSVTVPYCWQCGAEMEG